MSSSYFFLINLSSFDDFFRQYIPKKDYYIILVWEIPFFSDFPTLTVNINTISSRYNEFFVRVYFVLRIAFSMHFYAVNFQTSKLRSLECTKTKIQTCNRESYLQEKNPNGIVLLRKLLYQKFKHFSKIRLKVLRGNSVTFTVLYYN